ncbi:MAG TPA: iron-containing alcohol dehydrogenase [Candidatus Sulfomarinibacteraceae bacterium]|nr:iron-containing alcohol dehydrogenase [Candidatus Sulfomarinibacteraceae bacterium]
MSSFTYYLPTKIVFGQAAGEAVAEQLDALDARRVMLISDPGLAELGMVQELAQTLEDRAKSVHLFTEVSSNPTTDEVAAGLALARETEVGALVALGGGSPIDVSKGVALLLANGGSYADYQWAGKAITERSWPLIAVPTTAGTGSEVSKVAVVADPDNPFKKGVLSPLMFPHVAVLDPALTCGLPPKLTAATGMDAFIHALEAYVGKRANPHTDRLALDALETAWTYLPRATANGDDREAREQMMLAALWAGTAMDHSGLGLIHALSGPITSHLHLHHGLTNALLLPYVLRYNLPSISEERRRALNRVADLPEDADGEALVAAMTQFVRDLGLPTRLDELDVALDEVDWDLVAEETTRMVLIHNNPREATVADCRGVVEEMF